MYGRAPYTLRNLAASHSFSPSVKNHLNAGFSTEATDEKSRSTVVISGTDPLGLVVNT